MRFSAWLQVSAFQAVLNSAGRYVTVRKSKGDDEMAACGQLGNQELSQRPAPMLKPPERLRAAFS